MTDPKHYFITGCASGIGKTLADELAERGAKLTASDLHEGPLRDHAASARWPDDQVGIVGLDVTKSQQWARALDDAESARGPIDVLVNMAGFLHPAWVHQLTDDDIDRHVDINVKGVMFGTRGAAKRMLARKRGHIINVASMAALAPIPGIAVYSATKYAVRGFSLAAAQELRDQGIRVSVVCPDAVQTPMLDLQRDYEEAAMTFSAPRVLTAREVALTIVDHVVVSAPLECYIPLRRGLLARVADLFPKAAFALGPSLTRRGKAKQRGR